MELSLATRVVEHSVVVQIGGEVDVFTAPELRARFAELASAGHHHFIVDLENVTFLDSTGLGVLIGALKRVRPYQGSVQVVTTHERILKIFRITGLTRVFPLHASAEEAVASSRAGFTSTAAGIG